MKSLIVIIDNGWYRVLDCGMVKCNTLRIFWYSTYATTLHGIIAILSCFPNPDQPAKVTFRTRLSLPRTRYNKHPIILAHGITCQGNLFISSTCSNHVYWFAMNSLLEASEQPFMQVAPFLEELQAKEIQSPHLLSMMIDMYEQDAKENSKAVDPVALEVKILIEYEGVKYSWCVYVRCATILLIVLMSSDKSIGDTANHSCPVECHNTIYQ